MSFVTHDLHCTADHWESDVVYRRNDGPPPCPECGATRVTGWLPVGVRTVNYTSQMWKPLTHDGVTYETREDWSAYKAAVAKNTGVEIVETSNSDRHQRADEHRHRAWESRRQAGLDTTQWREVLAERARGFDPLTGRTIRNGR